jgi:hypothetical protein
VIHRQQQLLLPTALHHLVPLSKPLATTATAMALTASLLLLLLLLLLKQCQQQKVQQ